MQTATQNISISYALCVAHFVIKLLQKQVFLYHKTAQENQTKNIAFLLNLREPNCMQTKSNYKFFPILNYLW